MKNDPTDHDETESSNSGGMFNPSMLIFLVVLIAGTIVLGLLIT